MTRNLVREIGPKRSQINQFLVPHQAMHRGMGIVELLLIKPSSVGQSSTGPVIAQPRATIIGRVAMGRYVDLQRLAITKCR